MASVFVSKEPLTKVPDYSHFESLPDHSKEQDPNKNRSYNRRFRKMQKSATSYEFKKQVDFTDEKSVARYLTALDKWLKELKYPSDYDRFVSFSHTFIKEKPFRKLALSMLAQRGNRVALMMGRAYLSKLSKEKFEQFKIEPHFLETITFGMVAIQMFMFIISYYAASKMLKTVGQKYDTVVDTIDSYVTKPKETALAVCSGIKDIMLNVWNWFKERVKEVRDFLLPDRSVKGLVVFLIKALCSVLAMEYARTLFRDYYSVIRRWICEKLGFKDTEEIEAHAEGDTLEYLLSFINLNFTTVPFSKFMEHLGKLPKIVSVAKALEWCFTKFEDIYNTILEIWLGQPKPRTALERAVLAYNESVESFDLLVREGSGVVFAETTYMQENAIVSSLKKIEGDLMKSDPLRPYFSNILFAAGRKYSSIVSKLTQTRRTAKKRPTPIWLYVFGQAGVGKTTATEKIISYVHEYLREYSSIPLLSDFGYGSMFSYNQGEEYWDNYAGQMYVQVDDLFQSTSSEIRNLVASQLINLIANTPYALKVADMTQKQLLYFTSRLIISTTNLGDQSRNAFADQNLGLVSASALASRRTLSVEMMGYDDFRVERGFGDGDGNQRLTMLEVAAIIGEAIIMRHNESLEVIKPMVPDRFQGVFKTPRLVIDRFGLVKKNLDEREKLENNVKGKEKEEEDRERVAHGKLGRWVEGSDYLGPSTYFSDENFLENSEILGVMPWFMRKWYFKKYLINCLLSPTPEQVWLWSGAAECEEIDYVEFFKNYLRAHMVEDAVGAFNLQKHERLLFKELIIDSAGLFASLSQDDIAKVFSLITNRRSLGQLILCQFLTFTVVWYALVTMIRLIMPASAYEERKAHAKYDTASVQKNRGARVLKRTKAREVKRNKGRVVSHSNNDGYRIISNNYEIVECRMAPRGTDPMVVAAMEPLTSSFCLMIGGEVGLVPMHTMLSRGDEDASYERWISLVRHAKPFQIRFSDIPMVKEIRGDVAVVRFPGYMKVRNILGHFADNFPSYGKVEMLRPEVNSTMVYVEPALTCENNIREIIVNSEYEPYETDLEMIGIHSFPGLCGVVYTHRNTGKIVAVHMAGHRDQDIGYGVTMFKSDLEDYVNMPESVDPLPVELTVAHCKPGLVVLGNVPNKLGGYISKVSQLRHSLLDFQTFPVCESTDEPAHLTWFNGVSPLEVALTSMGKQYSPGRYVAKVKNLTDILPKTFNPENIRILSLDEAVYGIDGYISSIDMTSSSGYFWKRLGFTRRQLCYDKEGNRSIHPLLRRDVERKIDLFKSGKVVPVMFEENLKDEIRSKEKNDLCKTRLFSSGDFSSLIIQKMYLGTFMEEAMKDPSGCPIALSINPHSKEWGYLMARLKGREPRYLGAGDFQYYDLGLKNYFLGRFIEWISSFHPDPDLVERVIMGNAMGWHILFVLVFLRLWGTSSGSFITSLFNTFCNWLAHKEAFVSLYAEDDWHVVETAFVGDDSLFSVPTEYDGYNMLYLQKFFLESFGMVYTSPFKTGEMHVTWENVTFLKRTFSLTPQGLMAPLALKSLANMVKWCDKECTSEQMYSVCQSVLLEAFHYGVEFYDICLKWCVKQALRLSEVWFFHSFESMERLRAPDYCQ